MSSIFHILNVSSNIRFEFYRHSCGKVLEKRQRDRFEIIKNGF